LGRDLLARRGGSMGNPSTRTPRPVA
jgi:hypothetical protein